MEPGEKQTVKLEKRESSFDGGCRTVPASDMLQTFAAMTKQAEGIANFVAALQTEKRETPRNA